MTSSLCSIIAEKQLSKAIIPSKLVIRTLDDLEIPLVEMI